MVEVSVVFPCKNEEKTLTRCIEDAKKSLKEFNHEIIVVDNNSTDNSAEVAKNAGAKVISEKTPGYGSYIFNKQCRGFWYVP